MRVFVRLTAVVLFAFVFGGCAAEETDVYVGTYGEFLRNGELKGKVRLDDRTSHLALRLFRGEFGNLCGEVFFDGDVEIMTFDVWDTGNDPYPINELSLDLDKETVDGKIDIPDFMLNANFKGDFVEDFKYLEMHVDMLGEIVLERIEGVYKNREAEARDDEDRPEECR